MLRHNLGLALAAALLILAAGISGDHHRQCNENDDSVYIRPGKVHRYKYTADTETSSGGTTDKVAGVKIECTLEVALLKGCEYSLRTTECSLNEISAPGVKGQLKKHAKSAEFGQLLAKNTVVFEMHDGEVDLVRAPTSETPVALNIKRAIISGLALKQTASSDFEDRVDVQGHCPVKYMVDGNRVAMEKNIKGCRFPAKPDWQLSPYSLFWNQSFSQHAMIKSRQNCEWTLDAKQLKSGQCSEKHFMKFSRPDVDESISVYTTVVQSFELRGSARVPEKINTAAWRSTGIEFEHPAIAEPTTAPAGFPQSAYTILKSMVESSHNDIRLHVIHLFDQLITLLRQAPDVVPFTQHAFEQGSTDVEKHLYQAFVRDALVQCHTVPCVKALRTLVEGDKLTDKYVYHILATFSTVGINNPAYIEELLAIAKHKPSRITFLGLSATVNRYFRDHPGQIANVPAPVKETVNYMAGIIGDDCDHNKVTVADLEDFQKQEMVILVLKSIGNIGEVAQKVNPQLARKLFSCATNNKNAHNVTLEAIRATRKFEPTTYTYGRLLAILQDKNQDIDHRVAAYNILVNHWQDSNLVNELVKIVQNEQGQIHNYIVTHLRTTVIEDEAVYKELANNARVAISANPDIFNQLPHLRPASRRKEVSRHREVSWLPEGENEIGGHLKTDLLFEDGSYIPRALLVNLTSHLLGGDTNIVELEASLRGIDKLAENYFGPNGLFRGMSAQEVIAYIRSLGLDIIGKLQGGDGEDTSSGSNQPTKFANFDSAIENAINRLQQQITFDYQHEEPEGSVDLRVLGNTLAYTSLDLIKSRIQDFAQDFFASLQWDHSEWQRTRVIRFIEAMHLVPTYAGVPLVWDTQATLAYSLRVGSEGDFTGLLHDPKSFSAKWSFKPSAAVGLDMKIAIEVDGFTKAAFYSNSSLYHNSEMVHNTNLENGRLSFVRILPDRQIELLTLLRRNHLIRGDSVEDLPDFEADRVNNKWCADKILQPLTGALLCREKSYVNTTGRNKPYLPLAGNVDYRVTLEFPDKSIKEWQMVATKEDKGEGKFEYNVKLLAPGQQQREVLIKHERKPSTREFHLQVSVPTRPNVKIDIERKQLLENGQPAGYKTDLDISLIPGRVWKFSAQRHNQTEIRNKGAANEKVVRKSDVSAHLETPWSAYDYKREHESVYAGKLRSNIESRKTDISAVYTCNDEVAAKGGYLHAILPENFWEANRKTARIEITANVAPYSLHSFGKRVAHITLKCPQSTVQIDTDRQSDKAKDSHLKFDITKRNNADNKLLSFLNFAYTVKRTPQPNGMESIHRANLTVPRYSWQLDADRRILTTHRNRTFVFRREKMVAKNPSDEDHVGWWNSKNAGKFTPEDWSVQFRLDLTNKSQPTGSKDLIHNKWLADAELQYPRAGKQHTVTVMGKFARELAPKKQEAKYIADYTWESSYIQFRKHTYWNYLRTREGCYINHNFTLTHVPSQREAVYRISYEREGRLFGAQPNPVPFKINVNQNFTSRIVNFQQTLETIQRPDRKVREGSVIPQNMLVKMEIHSQSDAWDALNMDLTQEVDFDTNDGKEKMEFRHKYIDIDVKSNWEKPVAMKGYHKEFVIKGKGTILPSRNIVIDWKAGETRVKVDYPATNRVIEYKRSVTPDQKQMRLEVNTNAAGEAPQLAVDYLLRIDDPTHLTRIIKVNPQLVTKGLTELGERYHKLFQLYSNIRADANHPLNKALAPYLIGGTIASHVEARRQFWKENCERVSEAIRVVAKTQEPLVRPTAQLVSNLIQAYLRFRRNAWDAFYTYTYTGSAINSTDWREMYRDAVNKFAHRAIAGYSSNKQTGLLSSTMKWNHPEFNWPNFTTMPKLTGQARTKTLADIFMPLRKNTPVRLLPRFAAVYGTGNVYTFDGKSYDVSSVISSECTYLLADDLVHHKFSVLASQNAIHVLTPQLSATLERTAKVYINGSKTAADLPYVSGETRVSRLGNDFRIHVGQNDLTAVCNPVYGYCWVSTDRWRHNKTLGLFGNNDYQEYNDFKLPSGEIASDITAVMDSYELTGKPNCKKAKVNKLNCKAVADERCHSLFTESSSPLSRAFAIINPSEFEQNCKTDTECGRGICGTVRTFIALANIHLRRPISPPAECVRDVCGDDHDLESSWRETVGKEADVIFVVQQNVNLGKAGVSNHVSTTAKAVETQLKSKGFTNVQFGLIGYGGAGHRHQPHIYTSNGKMLSTAQEMVNKGLKNFEFDCMAPTAPELAVPHLKSYPHNANAAKVYVIIGFNHETVSNVQPLDEDGHPIHLEEIGGDNYILQAYLTARDSSVPKNVVDASNIVQKVEDQEGRQRRCSCDFHNNRVGVECAPY